MHHGKLILLTSIKEKQNLLSSLRSNLVYLENLDVSCTAVSCVKLAHKGNEKKPPEFRVANPVILLKLMIMLLVDCFLLARKQL